MVMEINPRTIASGVAISAVSHSQQSVEIPQCVAVGVEIQSLRQSLRNLGSLGEIAATCSVSLKVYVDLIVTRSKRMFEKILKFTFVCSEIRSQINAQRQRARIFPAIEQKNSEVLVCGKHLHQSASSDSQLNNRELRLHNISSILSVHVSRNIGAWQRRHVTSFREANKSPQNVQFFNAKLPTKNSSWSAAAAMALWHNFCTFLFLFIAEKAKKNFKFAVKKLEFKMLKDKCADFNGVAAYEILSKVLGHSNDSWFQ